MDVYQMPLSRPLTRGTIQYVAVPPPPLVSIVPTHPSQSGVMSCYVTEQVCISSRMAVHNADLIFLHTGLTYLLKSLAVLVSRVAAFAAQYKPLPTLGYTHFQPAQLRMVGKRATVWIQVRPSISSEVCA